MVDAITVLAIVIPLAVIVYAFPVCTTHSATNRERLSGTVRQIPPVRPRRHNLPCALRGQNHQSQHHRTHDARPTPRRHNQRQSLHGRRRRRFLQRSNQTKFQLRHHSTTSASFAAQIDTLARTVLRDIIGGMDMAIANTSRPIINDEPQRSTR